VTAPARSRARRRPEEAEQEIVDAAESLLHEGAYADLSVAAIMSRTGLGRSSFYVYFADLPSLLRTLASRIEGEFFAVSDVWLSGSGDIDAARQSTQGIVEVYVRHGPVLRALADAAATHPEVEQIVRWGMLEHFVDAITQRCSEQYAAGRIAYPVPRSVSRALVLMTERYLAETLGREPREDPADVAATLHLIWSRVLYAADELPQPRGPRAHP
jgi:AcrR family transcriptional regulator